MNLNFVNWTLWIATGLILILICIQFLKPKYTEQHQTRGKVILFLCFVILACVIIRGMHQEVSSITYSFHLIIGTLFFIALIATGIFGYLSLRNEWYMMHHKFCAYATLLLLIVTLIFGFASRFSH